MATTGNISSSSTHVTKSTGKEGEESEETGSENSQEQADLYQYEAQHFGFTPTSLINGMYNSVCDLYREALKAFAKACFEKFPDVMSEDELTTARHAVSEKIDKDISTVFDALEHYLLANVFSIPESVVLPEDRCQLQRFSDEEEKEVEEKKSNLKERIIAVKYANARLNQHLEESNQLQRSLDQLINKLSSTDGRIAQLNAEGVGDFISYYTCDNSTAKCHKLAKNFLSWDPCLMLSRGKTV
ncbi:mis12-like protein [Plakobranchus ocellatus]|uniref:Protein MIS12 homolog n=1 Tax=Plakobranchus ocellatus TaxID=259542 RepID=A0AAV4DMI0_9GAST|nr:mis12-like protein [Plakobranchus ocellatus]